MQSQRFLSAMNIAEKPSGPWLALAVNALGFLLAGVTPMLFGVGADNTSTLYGQFVMTSSFIVWIAVLFLWVKFRERRPIASIGFTGNSLANFLLGLALGLGLTTVVVVANLAIGTATLGSMNWSALLPALLLVIGFGIQASAEEIGYRGYLMQALGARWSVTVVVIAQAVLFTIGHVGNGLNPVAIVTMLAVSYCLAMWILATGNLWGAMSFHIFWNWSQANFWGASVSNIKMDTAVFNFTPKDGTSLITGGSFGLEGSLLTIAFLVGIGVFFHRMWLRNNKPARTLR